MWLISRRMGSALKDVFTDQPHTLRLAGRPGLYLRLGFYLSIFQSLCIYTWQPEPIVAKPIHTKNTQHSTNITTQTNEKREKLSRYWNETSAAEDHTYIFQRFPQNVAKLIYSTS